MENKKKSKGLAVKIIAILAVVGIILLALSPLLALIPSVTGSK